MSGRVGDLCWGCGSGADHPGGRISPLLIWKDMGGGGGGGVAGAESFGAALKGQLFVSGGGRAIGCAVARRSQWRSAANHTLCRGKMYIAASPPNSLAEWIWRSLNSTNGHFESLGDMIIRGA
nr:uncharacterized protein LOC123497205 [Aegilops tauschii subsp. strangulata]